MAKIFRDINDQKQYLEQTKNVLDKDNKTISLLNERAYVSVINPYKKLFSSGFNINREHIYPKSITVDDYISLCRLDDQISKNLHALIGIFERKLKNVIANILCKHMYDLGDEYSISYIEYFQSLIRTAKIVDSVDNVQFLGLNSLKYFYTKDSLRFMNEQYDRLKVDYRQKLLEYIVEIGNNVTTAKNSIVRFYQNKRETVPFWLLIHEMSFGEISEIYRLMSPNLRQLVYRQFENDDGSPRKYYKFERDLEFITKIRNTVNHYESFIVMLDIADPMYESTRDAIQRLIRFSKKSFIGYEKTPIDFTFKSSIINTDYNQKYRDRIENIAKLICQ